MPQTMCLARSPSLAVSSNFKSGSTVGFPAKPKIEKPLYLYCHSGNRASLAAQSLVELGFTHTTAVVMSLDEWQKTNQPFVK